MNAKRFVTLTLLFLFIALLTQSGYGSFLVDDDTLLNITKESVLIVAGKVSDIQYVQPDLKTGNVYTDVTIAVSKTLKGSPNINENTARFRIEGGLGIHPVNGKVFIDEVSAVPKFQLEQELILFLRKRTVGNWEKFYDGLYPELTPIL